MRRFVRSISIMSRLNQGDRSPFSRLRRHVAMQIPASPRKTNPVISATSCQSHSGDGGSASISGMRPSLGSWRITTTSPGFPSQGDGGDGRILE